MFNRKYAGAALAVMMVLSAAGCSSETAKDPEMSEEEELDNMEAIDAENTNDKSAQREEFSGTTPVDNEYVTLRIDSITENISADEYRWNAVLTNKSGQNLTTAVRGLSVNDYVIGDPEFDGSLGVGEEKQVTITFSGSDLIKNDIEEVAKASFDFYVYDEGGNVLSSSTNTVYPHGEAYYERSPRVKFSTEKTAFDNEFGTLIITSFDSYNYLYEVDIFFENKSAGGLVLDVTDESGYTQSFLNDAESAETNINISYVPAGGRTNTEIVMAANEERAEPASVRFIFSLRNPADNSIVYQQNIDVTPW